MIKWSRSHDHDCRSVFYVLTTEAATGRVLQKKVFLIISHYSQENKCVGDSNTRVFL